MGESICGLANRKIRPPQSAISARPYSVLELDELPNRDRVWATIADMRRELLLEIDTAEEERDEAVRDHDKVQYALEDAEDNECGLKEELHMLHLKYVDIEDAFNELQYRMESLEK